MTKPASMTKTEWYMTPSGTLESLRTMLEHAEDKIKRLEYGLTRIINVAPGSYEAHLARECLNLEETIE